MVSMFVGNTIIPELFFPICCSTLCLSQSFFVSFWFFSLPCYSVPGVPAFRVTACYSVPGVPVFRLTQLDCFSQRVTRLECFTAASFCSFCSWFWLVFGFWYVASIKPPVACLGHSPDALFVLEVEVQLGIWERKQLVKEASFQWFDKCMSVFRVKPSKTWLLLVSKVSSMSKCFDLKELHWIHSTLHLSAEY